MKFFRLIKGQTAIEYMLLLTICALIAFVSFRTFFGEPDQEPLNDAVKNPMQTYFNEVQDGIMGPAPNLPTSGGSNT